MHEIVTSIAGVTIFFVLNELAERLARIRTQFRITMFLLLVQAMAAILLTTAGYKFVPGFQDSWALAIYALFGLSSAIGSFRFWALMDVHQRIAAVEQKLAAIDASPAHTPSSQRGPVNS